MASLEAAAVRPGRVSLALPRTPRPEAGVASHPEDAAARARSARAVFATVPCVAPWSAVDCRFSSPMFLFL